ncbi:MAG: UDP-N-acetylmuramoylalanine--D-glutamate ligase [bacterium ADurb.Bin212]|nr:MAG: UDP-N-acetylmuramoylalanine--D-glutamate ligase [bacterium ADurb.Bin212]
MKLNELASKKVAVLGVGVEGVALCNYLKGKCADISLLDQKDQDSLLADNSISYYEELFSLLKDKKIGHRLGSDYLNDLDNFDVIFRSPGVRYLLPELQRAKSHGVLISSQINLFFDLCPCKIIGVTGTKGKGTTSSLIKAMLEKEFKYKVCLAGNIGYPAISLLDKIQEKDVVILELSSFQLQDLNISPHVAVVTNLSQDHLDYHANLEEYMESKKNIFKTQSNADYLVVNSSINTKYYLPAKSNILKFSANDNVSADAAIFPIDSGSKMVCIKSDNSWQKIVDKSQIKLVGDHNLENIAAAALVAKIFNIRLESISEAAQDFAGLPHRIEFVLERDRVLYYNDSYATNPSPTIAAIKSFSGDIILILGGSSKGADFSHLAEEVNKSSVAKVILIGDESVRIKKALMDFQFKGEIFDAGYDFQSAVELSKKLAKPGDVVLFSPACASFDMFKNYKDRGEKYRLLVNQLG